MHTSRKILALALVVVMASAMFVVAVSPRTVALAKPSTAKASNAANPAQSAPALSFSPTSRYFDPALNGASGRVDVIVAMPASAPTSAVAKYLSGARAMPSLGDVRLVRGLVDASKIGELQSSPYVLAVLKDRPIAFDGPKKPDVDSRLPAKFQSFHYPQPMAPERDSLDNQPETNMRDVVNFTGARRAWTQLGVDGTGVTIAVVDTGVDHGTFNLGESSVARDAAGVPMSFDPDGSTFAWTVVGATAYPSGAQTFITTSGSDPMIYLFDLFSFWPGGYGPKAFPWSFFFGGTYPVDMEVTGLPASLSGEYRFGVLYQWNFFIDLFPVVLIDATTAGVYDTVYLDLSFDWWLNGFSPAPLPDFSFSDEPRLSPTVGGNVVASRDMNLDGYPDISAGSLAWGLDIWGLDPTPGPTGYTYTAPVDAAGEYITMVYDWQGHGTSVAASAAGRESNHPLAGPGTGPGAKVMGVPIFAWFDIIEGWLWAAGFDLVTDTTFRPVNNYGGVYGDWAYTGNHKADIISNSWGSSDFLTFQQANGWPWYDVLTVFEDALMTPGYAAAAYPGTVMVHAGGNGASGYGTVTEPGFNSLAITVGASTNLNHTAFPGLEGTHYDVISWSARGPNLYGVPKPDLLQVGAYAWAAAPVWSGFGDGFFAFTLFGGTSQATPVTSGSAAVVIQAYKVGHAGVPPTPFEVKSALKSTALDIGYDAFVQGAGHIDVYNAAAYAIGMAGITTTTPASWDNLRPMVSSPWSSASVFYGQQVGTNPPVGPIGDTSWYAGAVKAGGSTTATFTTEAATGTATGTITPVFHSKMASSYAFTGTTAILPGLPGWWLEGFGAFVLLLPSAIPAEADLMVVRGSMPYSYLDPNNNHVWDNRSRIIVGDWVDNGNSVIEPSEVSVFNYGYNAGTTDEARVGLPAGRFAGIPLLWFSQAPAPGHTFVPMPFRIEVEFYDRVPWTWISAPTTFDTAASSTWAATLTVPAGTMPGVYEGQIIVAPAGANATAVPVSVVVPAVIDATTLSVGLTSSGSNQIYDPSTVLGYFDWRWRYESGDWKLWFVDVQDPSTISLYSEVSWVGANTDVDIISITPDSIPNDASFSPYLGSGNFLWSTRSGTTMDYTVTSTSTSFFGGGAWTGLYTIALHNVLLGAGGAAATPEALTGSVSAAKLNPRSPVVVTQPGTVVSVPFTLSTGYDIPFVFDFAYSPPISAFPSVVSPTFIPGLLAGESATFWLNITVAAGTPDGSYSNLLFVGGALLPGTFVPVNVIVDSTNPVVSIVAPGGGSYVRGTATLKAAVSDANGIAGVAFLAGSATGAMTLDPLSGLWTAPWTTGATPDGGATITVTATDAAGNSASQAIGVTVDNTPPTASFSSPAADAWLAGSVVVSFTATDANLDSATLTYGGTNVDVTGLSSSSIASSTLGDGPHVLILTVVDKAGNTATAVLAVNVDNTKPTAVFTSPATGSFLSGTVDFAFVATDAHLDVENITIGTTSIPVTGSSHSVDTAAFPDGTYTVTLNVRDLAGNAATDTVSVTIDNTDPVVVFTNPPANANLRGGATIAWTVTEANVDAAWLIVDGVQRDVTGTTSYSWNTATSGDGSHTIVVQVVDKAGNVGSATLTVTTDNVALAVNSGFTNGLLIGLVAAAVIGFLFGWFIGRRRKEKPEGAMAGRNVPSPPTMSEEEL